MNIETYTQPDRINMAHLALDEPLKHSSLTFDPRVDVGEVDKEIGVRILKDSDFVERERLDIALCTNLLTIDPSLYEQLRTIPLIQRHLAPLGARRQKLSDIRALHILNALAQSEQNLWVNAAQNIARSYLLAVIREYNNYPSTHHADRVMFAARLARLACPDYGEHADFLSAYYQRHFQRAEDTFIESWQSSNTQRFQRVWAHQLVRYASEKRFQHVYKQFPVDWEYMKKDLVSMRKKQQWQSFFRVAAVMTTVIAEKLIITPDRFEIVLPELVNISSPPPLPVLRDF